MNTLTKRCIRCDNRLLGSEERGEICNACLERGYGYGHDDASLEYDAQKAAEEEESA